MVYSVMGAGSARQPYPMAKASMNIVSACMFEQPSRWQSECALSARVFAHSR